jgi:dCTP deaminase
MLMTDGEIRAAMQSGKLGIENFSETNLEAASYDMRFGDRLLISSNDIEIDLSQKTSARLKPGEFALVTTYENIRLAYDIAGHIGVKSYYTRKGIVVLSGLQIDPGFEGVLVIGMYNASPRSLTLEYLAPFCTVEFHQLAKPAQMPFVPSAEQKEGKIPRIDKGYLRTLETESLSELAQSIRQMTQNVVSLSQSVKTMEWVVCIGLSFIGLIVVLSSILTALKLK